MKTAALPGFVALLAALAGPLAAIPAINSTPAVYRVSAVAVRGGTVVRAGDSAVTVVAHLGQPEQKMSRDIWIYRQFRSPEERHYQRDCTTLVVTFRDGRVTYLDRVNDPAVRWLAAHLPTRPDTDGIVAQQ
ncbi:MAG TPA: hypothetical protein VG734_05930 [Lacunisphaera sp.]|nr:hypothetical protein [Lacunisphaera sp.]